MIDRTTLDLRFAEHHATAGRVNQSQWRHAQPAGRPLRTAFASALVALAARLDPGRTALRRSPAAGTFVAAPDPR